jgi:hypothetical protein
MAATRGESRCIICGERKEGLEVRSDSIIGAMRWFKRNVTKNEKGYRLVVCKGCYLDYAKQRRKFERRQALYITIGVIFALVLVFVSINKITGVLYAIAVVVFMYILSILTYTPQLNMPKASPKEQRRKEA